MYTFEIIYISKSGIAKQIYNNNNNNKRFILKVINNSVYGNRQCQTEYYLPYPLVL